MKQVTLLVNKRKAVDVDFNKAFDTVSHIILLKKLAAHVLDWCSLHWVKTCLVGQGVVADGATSSWCPVTNDVPQA
ncbi:rna-directed dna polymerase from mobile element jockey-like [Pitangus sulphuratus]|nr:rna-directed dna polymerase from mobile element jockey-like [Pitangus sulphuratus]